MKSLSIRSIAVIASSQATKSPRPKAPEASALRSTPVENARPAPVRTTTRTSGRSASSPTTLFRSRTQRASPAFSTAGRSSVTRATGPATARRIVSSSGMSLWFTIKDLVTPLIVPLCLTVFALAGALFLAHRR